MLKNRVIYILFLAGMAVFHAFYSVWISWYALLLTLFLPVFSIIEGLITSAGLKIRISAAETCIKGQKCQAACVLEGRMSPPSCCRFWVEMLDSVSGNKMRYKLRLNRERGALIDIPAEHCGAYVLRPERARVYDFLGLAAFPVKKAETCTVTVLPEPQMPEPQPDFTMFKMEQYVPKPGGGFSEIHELRPYRPGDPLRSVHWKVTAKTEELIVREAQENIRREAIITFTLTANRNKLDRILSCVRWTSERLTELGTVHSICYIVPAPMHLERAFISCPDDLDMFMCGFLRERVAVEGPVNVGFPKADWHFHAAASTGEEAPHGI